jgi:arylsulfatase A-like enzyme
MKLNRLVAVGAALLALLPAARAQNESLAAIFTNADLRVVPERRPSIIFIQFHGLGCGDLSCYGQTNYQTPNLDRLAAEGMRFTNFRPDGTNFSDALAALVSGKKSGGHAATTIADRLQPVGYHTGLIGEWTLDAQPWRRGFNEFAGFLGEDEGRNYFAERLRRFAPHGWLTASNTFVDYDGYTEVHENIGGKKSIYMPEYLANALGNFIDNHAPDKFTKYQPFFLLADLPAPRSARAGADIFPVPSDAPFTDEKWPQAAKDRAALILRLDGGIGRLLQKLNDHQFTNGLAIFISSSAAPEKFADPKMSLFAPDNGVEKENVPAPLPMIVWWPEVVRAKQVSGFKWSSADLAPTVIDIAVAPRVKDLDGISILPVLQGKGGPQIDKPNRADRPF